jgi:putative membrane protein
MTIIDRIDCAATRAQLIAMAAVQDMGRAMRAESGGFSAEGRDPEEGATTVEYAIGTIAAAGFAGLLIVILKSDAVRAALESIIQEALNTR